MLPNPFIMYKLDKFLTPELLLTATGQQRVKRYPGLGNILAGYKRRLSETCVMTSIPNNVSFLPGPSDTEAKLRQLPSYIFNDETFTQEVTFSMGDYYRVTWNIEKAKEIIKRDNILAEEFNCEFISQDIDFSSVETERLKFASTNKDPIIVVDYHITNNSTGGLIVVDGNHRVVSRTLRGVKAIKGYKLNRDQQFEALADEFDKCIYKIHSNIHYIMDYMIGRESSSEYTFSPEV
ncbi:hypothetical protein [Paenibacillus sp. YAF4_2]|uniref:hypothetical protein n=1 Tax=Paenibacillus sp. YAF4_2 TaxID=3233085 RepID=UPI003F9BE34B